MGAAPKFARLAYAYLNSQFESGMKSPLDEAILARTFDAGVAARSTRSRSISSGGGLGSGRTRRRTPADRQGRAGGHIAAVRAYETADGEERPLDAETRNVFAGYASTD